jgi:hypothetical protein
LQPSVSVIFPSDPVVFFVRVNYLYNFSSNKPITTVSNNNTLITETAKVEPGDTFGFNFGMGFSMNERTSFSVGYEQYIIERPKSTAIRLKVHRQRFWEACCSVPLKLTERFGINFSLEAGLTEAAPDVN